MVTPTLSAVEPSGGSRVLAASGLVVSAALLVGCGGPTHQATQRLHLPSQSTVAQTQCASLGESLQFITPQDGWFTGGSVAATRDGGHTWSALPGLPCVNDQLDFVDLRDGWLAAVTTSGGHDASELLRTTDGGRTWGDVSAPRAGIRAFGFVDSLHGWSTNSGQQLSVSADGGDSWAAVATPKPVTNVCAEPGGHIMWITSPTGSIYRSTDDGKHWSEILTYQQVPYELSPPPASLDGGVKLACSGSTVWANYAEAVGAGSAHEVIERTSDAGGHWQAMASGDPTRPHTFLDVVQIGLTSPDDGWFFSASSPAPSASVAVTTDGGATFRTTTVFDSEKDPAARNYQYDTGTFTDALHGWLLYLVVTSAGVGQTVLLSTSDGGQHWSVADQNLTF